MSKGVAPSVGIGPYLQRLELCARADGLAGVQEVLRTDVDAAGL